MKRRKRMICLGVWVLSIASIGITTVKGSESEATTESTEAIIEESESQLAVEETELEPSSSVQGEQTLESELGDRIEDKYFESIPLGFIVDSEQKAVYKDNEINLYKHMYTNYVAMSDLEQLGLTYEDNSIVATNTTPQEGQQTFQQELKERVAINTEAIQIGQIQSYILSSEDEDYIPLRALETYFHLKIEEDKLVLEDRLLQVGEYVQIKDNRIQNISSSAIDVTIRAVYYDGEDVVYHDTQVEDLLPNQSTQLKLANETQQEGWLTLTYQVIKIMEDGQLRYHSEYDYGQQNRHLITYYSERAAYFEEKGLLEGLFPTAPVIGTMKYSVAGFYEGEEVEVLISTNRVNYTVKTDSKKATVVPWGSVSIPPNPKAAPNDVTKEEIEAFVSYKGWTSKTDYLVWTDLYRQRTYVLKKGANDEWELIRNMLCSTGNNVTPTPAGEYELLAYVSYFGVDKGYRCKNAVQFRGDYLYHSVIYDVTGTYLLPNRGTLGEKASNGCIRLSPEDSEWFYQTMPLGTKVHIR